MNSLAKFSIVIFFVFKSFLVAAWNSPTISTPANGTNTWTGTTLDWNAVANSQKYQIQIDTTLFFNSGALVQSTTDYINSSNTNSDTKYDAADLYFGKAYYWRVRALVTGDTSSWTQGSFNTVDYITLNTPVNASSNWTGLSLDWDAHPTINFYDIQVDTTSNFNSPVLIQANNTYINGANTNSDTKYDLSDLFFGKTYYWRVRARNDVDTSAWTSHSFATVDYVTLNTPTNASLEYTGLTLDWDAHPTVNFYDFQADTTSNFNSPLLVQTPIAYINAANTNSDTKYDLAGLYFGETYYWRVRARNNVDTSAWTLRSFDTKDYVTLVSPTQGQLNVSTSGTTLDWDAHPSVSSYHLQFDTVSTFNSSFLIDQNIAYINASNSNNDTKYTTGALLANKVYYWRVKAINAVDNCAWTARYFSTGNCQGPGTISGNTDVCEGTSYTYNITTVTGVTSYNWVLPSGWTGSSSTNSITVTPSSNGGNIKVSVNNPCGVSAQQSLTVTVSQLPYQPSSISGSNIVCQEQSTVTYTVPAVSNATSYLWTLPSGATGTSTTASITVNYGTSALSGNISVKGVNTCGNGPASTFSVTVNTKPPTPNITLNGNVLHSNAVAGNQWYNQSGLINNAILQDYTAVANGNHYVIVTLSGCTSSSSNIINVVLTSTEIPEDNKTIYIYPNPTTDFLILKIDGDIVQNRITTSLFDINGKLILSKSITENEMTISMKNLTPATYFLKVIQTKDASDKEIKTIKIIKQ